MIGFFIGIGSLLGLRWALRRSCRGGAWYHHGQWRGAGCGAPPWQHGPDEWHEGRPGRGFGPLGARRALRMLFWRLDTSPGQEKAIRAEIEKLVERLWTAKRSLHQSRGALAQAMRGEKFDEAPIAESLAAHEHEIREIKGEIMAALGRVHEVLDQRQRELLAEMLEPGTLGKIFGGGPYRS